jgi:predicted nucleic acid-binding protein
LEKNGVHARTDWIRVVIPRNPSAVSALARELDAGESEAIVLAGE